MQKFEDTKEATRSRKSKEDTQYNDKKKKTQGQAKIYKTLHRKQNIEQHELNYKPGVDSCAPERINIYYNKSFISLSDFTFTNCLRSLISQSYVSTTN